MTGDSSPSTLVPGDAASRPVAWIVGDGRSGTTWLSEILNHDCWAAEVFEPFHPMLVDTMRDMVPFQVPPGSGGWPRFRAIVDSVFGGSFRHPRATPSPEHFESRKGMIIKDIFAHLMVPWVLNRHPHVRTIVILRHPFSVAASKVALNDACWMRDSAALLEQPSLRSTWSASWQKELRGASSQFCKYVATWCAIHRELLGSLRSGQVKVVFYEALLSTPLAKIRELRDWIGSPLGAQAADGAWEELLDRPSRVSDQDPVARSSRLSKWQSKISADETAAGMRILERFGLDELYGLDLLPNEGALSSLFSDGGKPLPTVPENTISTMNQDNGAPKAGNGHMLINISHAEVGYGRLGFDGDLGYQTNSGRKVSQSGIAPESILLSAHAPSEIKLSVTCRMRVHGFLSDTAALLPSAPATFTLNEHPLGQVRGPGDRTAGIEIPPGDYTLRVACKIKDFRHTVWELLPCPENGSSTADKQLEVVTIACYPPQEAPEVLWPLARSAQRFGHLLSVTGVGTCYEGHTKVKITRLLDYIKQGTSEYVLFADGRDTLILADEEEIIETFKQFDSDFVISMESGCWPIFDASWRTSFPEMTDGRNWPNAGGWMGTRKGVIRVLTEAYRLQQDLIMGPVLGNASRWHHHLVNMHHDDQILLQFLYLEGKIKGDDSCRLFTNVGTADRRITDNPEFEFGSERVKLRSTGAEPSVIHFSGSACDECRDQWAARLGA